MSNTKRDRLDPRVEGLLLMNSNRLLKHKVHFFIIIAQDINRPKMMRLRTYPKLSTKVTTHEQPNQTSDISSAT